MNPEDFVLRVNGELFEPTPESLELYTFRPPNEHINHVYIIVEESDLMLRGIYVWAHQKAYEALRDFIRQQEWPRHEDLHRVPPEDLSAYEIEIEDMTSDLEDRPEWL